MKIVFGTLAYVAAAFIVQATSHFAINKAHYAAVSFLRPEPIFLLGSVQFSLFGLALR